MIPKIIHYCWFGKGKMPEEANKLIETWKENCPDYEIIRWDESNFDIESNDYVKEAYKCKKYAFVTDYVRLYALYNYGGIYMDTDVEVCKSFDELLNNEAFSGYESTDFIPTGTMASSKNNKWIKLLLDDYKNIHFLKNGIMDLTTNTQRITETTLKNYNIKLDGRIIITDDFTIYPFDYLCAKDWYTGKIYKSDNTYTIHHFAKSWQKKSIKIYGNLRRFMKKSNFFILKKIDKFLDYILQKEIKK
ncbi:glycosyltransferase family 32 protein [Faecalibacillus intestinalis]|uniref:glycosyltransferase family 32 protein n=1 Tax=Faecalibacillus intestinalis TaxID=1982626 RepID=UPI0035202BC3